MFASLINNIERCVRFIAIVHVPVQDVRLNDVKWSEVKWSEVKCYYQRIHLD